MYIYVENNTIFRKIQHSNDCKCHPVQKKNGPGMIVIINGGRVQISKRGGGLGLHPH